MTDTSKEAVTAAIEELRDHDLWADEGKEELGRFADIIDALAAKCDALEESLLQANERLLRFQHGLEEGVRERKALEASNERLARDVKGLLDQLAALTEAKDDALTPYLTGAHAGKEQGRKEALEEAAKVAFTRATSSASAVHKKQIADAIRALIEKPPDAG